MNSLNKMSIKNKIRKIGILAGIVSLGIYGMGLSHVSTVYASGVDLSDGLVGYWKLDGNVNDSSGNGNDGTLYGNTSFTTGKLGESGSFDGTGDYIDIGTGPTSVNSISFWTYPTSTTEYFINVASTTDYISASSGTVSASGFTSPTIYINGIESTTLTANTWQHIVITTETAENASNFDIGRTADANYFNGKMDDVRLYNRALSSVEVEELYRSSQNLLFGSDLNASGPNPLTVSYSGSTATNTVTGNILSSLDLLYPISSSFSERLMTTPGAFGSAIKFDGVDDSLTTNTVTAGLVGWWKMDESVSGDGQTIYDSSGNGNDGTTYYGVNATGMDCTVAGKSGHGCDFDGADDYICIHNPTTKTCVDYDGYDMGLNDWAVSLWLKGSGTDEYIIAKDNNGNTDMWEVAIDNNGKVFQRMYNGSTLLQDVSTTSVNDDNWHHVATTWDRDGNAQIFVDGVSETTYDISSFSAEDFNNGYALHIGNRGSIGNFNGSLDDVRIYNRAITQNEISQLYKEGSRSLSDTSVSLTSHVKPSSVSGVEPGGTLVSKSDNYSLSVVGDDKGNSRSAFTTNLITSQLSGTSINDVYFYDTTKDTIDNSWRFDTTKSWYTETIDNTYANCNVATDDRCGTKYFPEKVYIVATDSNVYIFDAEENAMWMRFALGSYYAIGQAGSVIQTVFMMNNKLYVGTNTTGWFNVVDFSQDYFYGYVDTLMRTYSVNVDSRNTSNSGSYSDDATKSIVSREINDVYANVISGKTYIAVATDAGVSVINETDGVVYDYADNASDNYNAVWIDQSGDIFAVNETTAALEKWKDVDADSVDKNPGTPNTVWDEASAPPLWSTVPTILTSKPSQLFVTDGTSTNDGSSETVFLSHTNGLSILNTNNTDETNGSVKYITKDYVSEDMIGDIRGMWALYGTSGSSISDNTYNIDDISVKSSELTAKNANGTGMSYVDGVRGTAIDFDGTDDYLCTDTNDDGTCDDDSDLDLTTAISMGAWVTKSSNSSAMVMVKGDTTATSGEKGLFLGYGYDTSCGSNNAYIFGANNVQNEPCYAVTDYGSWHFIVGTYDGVSRRLYVDGVLRGTTAGTQEDLSNAYALYVGADKSGDSMVSFFNGTIDEPFVTGEVLTADQIKHMYEVGKRALENSGSDINKLGGTSSVVNAVTASTLSHYKDSSGVDKVGAGTIYAGTEDGISKIDLTSDSRVQFWNTKSNTSDPYYISNDAISSLSSSSGGGFIAGTGNGVFRLNDVSGINNLDNNKFTQVTGIYDAITGYYKLYEDGILVGRTNVGTGNTLPTNSNSVTIGSSDIPSTTSTGLTLDSDKKQHNTNYNRFYGAIDNPEVHASVLDPRDINYMVDNKATPVVDMRFDEGYGSTAYNQNWSKVGETTNLVTNPGYEEIASSSGVGNATVTQANNYAKTGNGSMKISFTSGATAGATATYIQTTYVSTVDKSKSYTYSVWYKGDTPASGTWKAYVTGSNGACTHETLTFDDTWRKFSCTVNIGLSGLASENIRIYLYSGTLSSAVNLYLDNLQVTESSSELPYCDGSLSGPGEYKWNGTPNSSTSTCSYGVQGDISGASYIDGVEGKALRFDGVSDYVDLGNSSMLNPNKSDYTVSTWFKSHDLSGGAQFLVSDGNNSSGDRGWSLFLQSNILYWRVNGDNTTTQRASVSTSITGDDKWNHFVGVIDRRSEKVAAWINADNSPWSAGGGGPTSDDISSFGEITDHTVNSYLGKTSNDANYFNGDLDLVKIFPFALTSSEIKTEYNLGAKVKLGGNTGGDQSSGSNNFKNQDGSSNDSLTDGLVGWWKMDETTMNTCTGSVNDTCDSSGNGNDGAWVGNVASGTGKFGSATTYDGSGDYVNLASDASVLKPTRNLTVSAWVNPSDVSTWHQIVTKRYSDTLDPYNSYNLATSNEGASNKWRFCVSNGTTGSQSCVDDVDTLVAGSWSHVMGTYDGSTIKLYVNGVLKNSASKTGDIGYSTIPLRIGLAAGVQVFKGTIDDVRIYNRTLSEHEVSSLYYLGPPPVAHWTMDENQGGVANDKTENTNDGTLTNGPEWVPGAKGSALSFDGTDDYVKIPSDGSLNFGSNDFTISYFAKYISTSPNGQRQVSKRPGSTGAGWSVGAESTCTALRIDDGTNSVEGCIENTNYYDSLYRYYVFVFDRNNGQVKSYVNGVYKGSVDISLVTGSVDNSIDLNINTFNNLSTYAVAKDVLDDVKIYNYALTPYQIAKEFNGGKSLAEYKFDEGSGQTTHNTGGINATNYNSAYDNSLDGTLGGSASTTTNDPTWVTDESNCAKGGCMSFDGTDDYLNMGDNSEFEFAAGQSFSLSVWFKGDYDETVDDGLITKGYHDTSSNCPLYVLEIIATGDVARYKTKDSSCNNDEIIDGITDVTDGNWHHIMSVRNSDLDKIYLYVDGILENSADTLDYAVGVNTDPLIIGNHYDRYTEGLLDEVKIFDYALSPEDVVREYNMGSSVRF